MSEGVDFAGLLGPLLQSAGNHGGHDLALRAIVDALRIMATALESERRRVLTLEMRIEKYQALLDEQYAQRVQRSAPDRLVTPQLPTLRPSELVDDD